MAIYDNKVSNTPILVKTLRDGSKRYRSNACPKCGGAGYLRGYEFIDGARCWKCNATGYFPHEWIEPSDERIEKERIKNKAKLIARAESHNKDFLKWHGFNENGKAYIVLGDTYAIKDEIKAMGGKFDNIMGWTLPDDTDKFPTAEIDIHNVVDENDNGWWGFKPIDEITAYIEKIKADNTPHNEDDHISEYVGNVGEKITVDVSVKGIYSFETHYSYYGETSYIYKFEDKNGNIYTWKTAGCLDKKVGNRLVPIQEGEDCTITGTIKDHKEYKGEKETVLTRVKLS